jgi:hypothetical protein
MFHECNECQVVVRGAKAPFVCPNCGLAGVGFSPISDKAVAKQVADGEGEPINLDALAASMPAPAQPRIR